MLSYPQDGTWNCSYSRPCSIVAWLLGRAATCPDHLNQYADSVVACIKSDEGTDGVIERCSPVDHEKGKISEENVNLD